MKSPTGKNNEDFIPLFPLGVVLLPRMTLPLHIFEERYKVMIRECLDRDKPFGIVYVSDNQIRKVGCTARIQRVLKQYEDGRMDIITEGEERFYIEDIDDSRIYMQSSVRYFDDDDEAPPENQSQFTNHVIELLKQLDEISTDQRYYNALSQDPKGLSFLIPGTQGFTPEERQQFLEMTSTRERLLKGLDLMKMAIERLKIDQEVRKISGGNGDLHKFLKH